MSAKANSSQTSPPALRWRLWIDGCGGYLLLTGNRWTVGGLGPSPTADICVRADWPRQAGEIRRNASDYFWHGNRSEQQPQLIADADRLPIPGTASISLCQPSPLSNTAALSLAPPHRFDHHVDAVILVDETLIIGSQSDCHIRCVHLTDRAVLSLRGETWRAKLAGGKDFDELEAGCRRNLNSLAMTLEEA